MDDIKIPLKPYVTPVGAKRLAGVDHQQLARSASEKLKHLRFDPIAELVGQYEFICGELTRMNHIRDNMHDPEIVPEYVSKKYSQRLHIETYDRLVNITKELLRYGYARVSESNELITKAPPMLQIQLTKKGDVFEIGVPSVTSSGDTSVEQSDDKW